MEVKRYENGLVELYADEGKLITEANIEDTNERTFAPMVCLSKYGKPEDFEEWDKDIAAEFEAKRDMAKESKAENNE